MHLILGACETICGQPSFARHRWRRSDASVTAGVWDEAVSNQGPDTSSQDVKLLRDTDVAGKIPFFMILYLLLHKFDVRNRNTKQNKTNLSSAISKAVCAVHVCSPAVPVLPPLPHPPYSHPPFFFCYLSLSDTPIVLPPAGRLILSFVTHWVLHPIFAKRITNIITIVIGGA